MLGRDSEVALAIARFALELLEVDADPVLVERQVIDQLDVDLFEDTITLGDLEVDSMAIVELLVTVEERLGLDVFERDGEAELWTLRGVAALVVESVPEPLVDEFIRYWATHAVAQQTGGSQEAHT
jgi:acyl carrier protein